MRNLMRALSIVLVVAVIFLFLRNIRATLIPSVAMPLSVIGTFMMMYVLGFSVDNFSLLALTLAVVAIWGYSFVPIKVALTEVPPFTLAAVRFFVAAVPMVFFVRAPAMPWRGTAPSSTLARWRTRIGVPPRSATTTFSMSSTPVKSPMPRIRYCWRPCST